MAAVALTGETVSMVTIPFSYATPKRGVFKAGQPILGGGYIAVLALTSAANHILGYSSADDVTVVPDLLWFPINVQGVNLKDGLDICLVHYSSEENDWEKAPLDAHSILELAEFSYSNVLTPKNLGF